MGIIFQDHFRWIQHVFHLLLWLLKRGSQFDTLPTQYFLQNFLLRSPAYSGNLVFLLQMFGLDVYVRKTYYHCYYYQASQKNLAAVQAVCSSHPEDLDSGICFSRLLFSHDTMNALSFLFLITKIRVTSLSWRYLNDLKSLFYYLCISTITINNNEIIVCLEF